MAAVDRLEMAIKEIFNAGGKEDENVSPDELARKLAKAIDDYIIEKLRDEVLIYIPPGTVVTQVVGQATGIPNLNLIEIKVMKKL